MKAVQWVLCVPSLLGIAVLGTSEASASLSHARSVAGSGYVDGLVLGDVDGDGRLEALSLTRRGSFLGPESTHGAVTLFDSSGELLWEKELEQLVVGHASFADLDGDGQEEIVVCESTQQGLCLAFDGQGTPLWSSAEFYIPGMSASGPTAADFVGGPGEEVVVASWGGEVALLDGSTGEAIWRNEEAGARGENFFGNPVVGDLNGDGTLDIVVADYTLGSVVAFDGESGAQLWRSGDHRATTGHYAQASSALITELDGNRSTREVVVTLRGASDSLVLALDHEGAELWRRTLPGLLYYASPLAADTNGDFQREILVGNLDGDIYQLDRTGQVLNSRSLGIRAPLISFADVTGDQVVELIVAGSGAIEILDGRNFSTVARHEADEEVFFYPNAVIADQDQDGGLELVTGSWRARSVVTFDLQGASGFSWKTMGGADTYHGEHALGGVSGGALTGLESIRNELIVWSEDASLNSGSRDRLAKAAREVERAIERISAGQAKQTFDRLAKAMRELMKAELSHSDLMSLQDALFEVSRELAQASLDYAREEMSEAAVALAELHLAGASWWYSSERPDIAMDALGRSALYFAPWFEDYLEETGAI